VEAAGGSIGVRSKPCQGSTFTVRLPITQEAASYPPPPTTEAEAQAGQQPTQRLLLIEGNPATPSVRQAFQDHYDVVSAVDMEEATRLLETGALFELVLCDVDLADLEALVEIQHRFGALHDRLVLVTSATLSAAEHELLGEKQISHVRRPLSVEAVRQLLSHRSKPT
jgi:CheY-like chemotaxis protein